MPQRTQPPERSADAGTPRGPAIYRVEHTFGSLVSIAVALHPWIKRLEPWGILLVVVAFIYDFQDRRNQAAVNSWQLLTTRASGNSGKIQALEYLHGQGVPLVGIDLSPPDRDNGTPDNPYDDPQGAYLRGVILPGAVLSRAKLSRADLSYAKLSRADLSRADLSEADLSDAALIGAYLIGADLSSAILYSADLSGAMLRLRYVGLHARNLTQEQLNSACGDEKTELPEGLTIPMCEK